MRQYSMPRRILLKRIPIPQGFRYNLRCCGCRKAFWIGGFRFNQGVGKFCSAPCFLSHNGFKHGNKLAAGNPRAVHAYSFPSGSANPKWKGNKAKILALHTRLYRARGKPKYCESCGLNDPNRRYEWSNQTGNYVDLSDYKRLCVPCHRRFDYQRRLNHRRSTQT